MNSHHRVLYYRTDDGRVPFADWLRALTDPIGRHRIRARLKLLEFGQLGDWKSVGQGVIELRIHAGPGYRLYCGRAKQNSIVMLWAGHKGQQNRDIARAIEYWKDYLRRTP